VTAAPPPANLSINTETRGITDLRKIYNDNSKKYSNAKYEYIQKKLTIFKNNYILLGIINDNIITAIPILLTGRTLDYFYNRLNLARQNIIFEEIITSIKDYFKILEVRQAYLNEWNSIRFYSIINDNPDRSRSDCFELVFDILIKI
jgi:hypothetical protein